MGAGAAQQSLLTGWVGWGWSARLPGGGDVSWVLKDEEFGARGQKAPMMTGHTRGRSWAGLLTLKHRGHQLFRAEPPKSRLGPLLWVRVPGTHTAPLNPDLQKLYYYCCCFYTFPRAPRHPWGLRSNTDSSSGMGGSWGAEMAAANKLCLSSSKPNLRVCSVPSLGAQQLGAGKLLGDKTQSIPSIKSTKEAAFPKVGSQEPQSFKSPTA